MWAAAMRPPPVQRQGDGGGGGGGEREGGGDALDFATGSVGSACGREGEASARQGGGGWPDVCDTLDAPLCDSLASTHSLLMFA